MSQDIVCTIEYPGEIKSLRSELIEEFKSQIVTNSNKIMLYCNQKLLDPNVPFRKQNVQNGATILMNVEVEGGGDFERSYQIIQYQFKYVQVFVQKIRDCEQALDLQIKQGKYKEEELIDAGGYSQIWKCEGFAIKRMLIHSQETYLMAKQEINIMKRLPEHPNIVRLIDYGEVKIQNKLFFCIVMELCEMNLQAMLTQEMLTESRIIEIFKQILDGLEVLHAEQISHRDLKLENIMIRRGTCKICDFGSASNEIIDLNVLSQTQLSEMEEQFSKITTITCRPPEMIDVFKRQIIDFKVDIWQLGCILYSLCFRKSPFQDINKVSIAQAEFEIPQSQLSQKTVSLIQKMLQLDPKKRPNLKELKLFLYSREIDDGDDFQ